MPSTSSTGNGSVSNVSPGGTSNSSKGKSPITLFAEFVKNAKDHIKQSPVGKFFSSRSTSSVEPNSVQEVYRNGSSSLETVTGDALLEIRETDEVVDIFVENDGLCKAAFNPGQVEEPLIPGVDQPLRVSTRVRKPTDPFNVCELGNVSSQTVAKTGSKKENDSLTVPKTAVASAIGKTVVPTSIPLMEEQLADGVKGGDNSKPGMIHSPFYIGDFTQEDMEEILSQSSSRSNHSSPVGLTISNASANGKLDGSVVKNDPISPLSMDSGEKSKDDKAKPKNSKGGVTKPKESKGSKAKQKNSKGRVAKSNEFKGASANGESDGASSSTSPPPSSLDEIEGPWQNPSRKLTGKIAYGDSSSNSSSTTSVVEKKSNLESGEKKRGRLGFWDESDVFKVVKKFIDNFAIDPNLTKIAFLRKESLLYGTNLHIL